MQSGKKLSYPSYDAQQRLLGLSEHEAPGKALAVLTSGGDSQGMNAAVRAIVRFGLYLNSKVFLVREGYQGLVTGGTDIHEAEWSDVSSIIHRGGTVLGSARCMEFKKRDGRLKAAKNLVDRNIQKLIVIGGDGSLTGANIFRDEWCSLLEELEAKKEISAEQLKNNLYLNIVGIVGSIDNDFCGTDMTIGTDSALQRISTAIDDIFPTASSHRRTFIMEVMGRHCGYIALSAAIATEADFLFIPECPPEVNWPERLCKKLQRTRELEQRLNIIIIAEGATDREGKRITAEDVKREVVANFNHDTRISVLGHIQRGGAPTAFDRILGCRMGAEAVLAVLKADKDSEPTAVTLSGNSIFLVPLMECVKMTQKVAQCLKMKDWDTAIALRGRAFKRNLEVYRRLSKYQPKSLKPREEHQASDHHLAILQFGTPAAGMNAAVNAFVRNCIITGNTALAVMDGFEGLAEGRIKKMDWKSVNGWVTQGGANLGSLETMPDGKFDQIALQIREHNIKGIAIVGGFDAFMAIVQLYEQRRSYPEFQIPIVLLPATMSNNVPGTEFSIGSDTALNEITRICDGIRQSAQGTKRKVFIVETMGGYCGYLTTMAGLASGCDTAYIFEEEFDINSLYHDLEIMADKMLNSKVQRGLILSNEKANGNYTTDFIRRMYAEEGKGTFVTRSNSIGHIQQGGNPSVFDRNLGIKMATKAHKWLLEQVDTSKVNSKESACVIGLNKSSFVFRSVEDLIKETDVAHRIWTESWWLQQRDVMKILARHESDYHPEFKHVSFAELKQVL